jgi:hypothetical protein
MADVVPIELHSRYEHHTPVCSTCVNGYLGAYGVYCIAYREHINDEVAAASDCPEWEES